MHIFFFQFDLLFIFYTSISPTCVNDTHAHCRTCVCMCMLPEHDNWIPSFTLFSPFVSSSIWLSYFSSFFQTQFALLTFLFGLRLWEHDILELRNVSTSSFFVLCACVLCVTFLCLSLFILFFTRKSVIIILLLNSMELASGLVFPCLPVLSFLNSS